MNTRTLKTITLTRPTKKATKATKKRKKERLSNTYAVNYDSFYLVFTCMIKPSSNEKTGEMIQTYLIDKESINEPKVFGAKCSDCPIKTECYVNKDKLSVRSALKRLIAGENTSYKWSTIGEMLPRLKGRSLRWGTYGDPSAIPLSDLKRICSVLKSWTGYTHYFHEIDQGYSAYLMASCESVALELLAQSLGYRTYRVLLDEDDTLEILDDSIQCPNYTRGLTCLECGLCNGQATKAKSIYVYQH